LTERSLSELVVERVDVSRSDFAYSQLVEKVWSEGKSFLLIEHDIELTYTALKEAMECPCEWSTSPYKGSGTSFDMAGLNAHSLGFTRFREALIAAVPDAVSRANAIDDSGSICPPGHWKLFDGRLLSILRQEGHEPHVHSEVPHHHAYPYGCSCGGEHGQGH
jgi:hypothetical protein